MYFAYLTVRQIVGIRQNGESQNGCFKKTMHAKFSEKRTFLTLFLRFLFYFNNIGFSTVPNVSDWLNGTHNSSHQW